MPIPYAYRTDAQAPVRSLDPFGYVPRHIGRNRKSECLGGPRVDDELECRGLFDWEVGRLCAAQNPVRVVRGLAPLRDEITAIGHQTPTATQPRAL
jgi:hypothetical protein